MDFLFIRLVDLHRLQKDRIRAFVLELVQRSLNENSGNKVLVWIQMFMYRLGLVLPVLSAATACSLEDRF